MSGAEVAQWVSISQTRGKIFLRIASPRRHSASMRPVAMSERLDSDAMAVVRSCASSRWRGTVDFGSVAPFSASRSIRLRRSGADSISSSIFDISGIITDSVANAVDAALYERTASVRMRMASIPFVQTFTPSFMPLPLSVSISEATP